MTEVKLKFNEDKYLNEVLEYITSTYTKHYSAGDPDNVQTFEMIVKNPDRGYYFSTGNLIKYSDRCGMKDDERKELLKIAHYAILALYSLDKKNGVNISENN